MDVEHTPSSPASKKRRHLGRYHRAVRVSRQGDSKRTSWSGWRPARRYQRAEEQSVGVRVGPGESIKARTRGFEKLLHFRCATESCVALHLRLHPRKTSRTQANLGSVSEARQPYPCFLVKARLPCTVGPSRKMKPPRQHQPLTHSTRVGAPEPAARTIGILGMS